MRHLAVSRVSSHETKTRCIEGFFTLCATPSAFIRARRVAVEEVIKVRTEFPPVPPFSSCVLCPARGSLTLTFASHLLPLLACLR